MLTLDEIALTTSTDRSSKFHGYMEYYDQLFTPFRDKPVRLLEIGILGGDGLRCWSDYFTHPMTTIIGVDLHDRNFQTEDRRVSTIYGDAGDQKFLESLGGPWSIVIDDGSHFASHQMTSFNELWAQLAPGGIFICEDCHCVHSVQHCDTHANILKFFELIMESIQDPAGAKGCAAWNKNIQSLPESIEVRSGLIIVRKRK